MGLFDKLMGNKSQKATNVSETSQSLQGNKVDLGKEQAIATLNLRKDTLKISLEKKSMINTKARVAVVMDNSGSMESLYRNGKVQSIIEKMLPLALKLDDNGELDMWIFSNKYWRLNSTTENDFFGYVKREIMGLNHSGMWCGTSYAPAMRDVVAKYTKEEPSDIPTLVLFITDGENGDKADAIKIIQEASKHNIFWQFIGIGSEDFEFLKKLDTIGNRMIDNANFFQLNDIDKLSDQDLYDRLLAEYPLWEKEFKQIKGR